MTRVIQSHFIASEGMAAPVSFHNSPVNIAESITSPVGKSSDNSKDFKTQSARHLESIGPSLRNSPGSPTCTGGAVASSSREPSQFLTGRKIIKDSAGHGESKVIICPALPAMGYSRDPFMKTVLSVASNLPLTGSNKPMRFFRKGKA